jgi:hypothetical protein
MRPAHEPGRLGQLHIQPRRRVAASDGLDPPQFNTIMPMNGYRPEVIVIADPSGEPAGGGSGG